MVGRGVAPRVAYRRGPARAASRGAPRPTVGAGGSVVGGCSVRTARLSRCYRHRTSSAGAFTGAFGRIASDRPSVRGAGRFRRRSRRIRTVWSGGRLFSAVGGAVVGAVVR